MAGVFTRGESASSHSSALSRPGAVANWDFAARAIAMTNCAFESLRLLMNERRVMV